MDSNDLAKVHNDSSTQFAYFLTAAAGASIAYALTKLDGQTWSQRMVPGLIALALWMLSFFSGCMQVTWGQKALRSNYLLLLLSEGRHPKQPTSNVEQAIALNAAETSRSRKELVARRFEVTQVWTFYLGVMVFMGWRLAELFAPHVVVKLWCFIPGFSI